MSVLGSLAEGLKLLLVGGLTFFGVTFAWAPASGFLAGMLDAVGIVLPSMLLLAAGPIVGVIAAAYAVSRVSSS